LCGCVEDGILIMQGLLSGMVQPDSFLMGMAMRCY